MRYRRSQRRRRRAAAAGSQASTRACAQDASEHQLVLLDAPVGYGKSTLLTQWRESEEGRRSFAWLTLTEQDSDPTHLLGHLVASLRQVDSGFGATVETALEVPGAGPSEGVLRRMLDDLAALPLSCSCWTTTTTCAAGMCTV